jgi:hypothetical protein
LRMGRIRKLMSVALVVLLASCSATRSTGPVGVEELTRFVLVISESPDGQFQHSWRHAEEFDLTAFRYQPAPRTTPGRIVLASSRSPDCYAQYLECYHLCLKTPVPPDFEHYLYDFGPAAGHERYCSEQCMRRYSECARGQGRGTRRFMVVDEAIDWLKSNREAVLVGSLVVIAGVVFVTVSAGAGLVVLAPVVLVASSGIPVDAHFAVVSP